MNDRDDLLERLLGALWTVSVSRLARDPNFSQDLAISALMEELAAQPGLLLDSEAFERGLRAHLARGWPEIVERAEKIRALIVEDLHTQNPTEETP